jgi:hypothetical protein
MMEYDWDAFIDPHLPEDDFHPITLQSVAKKMKQGKVSRLDRKYNNVSK